MTYTLTMPVPSGTSAVMVPSGLNVGGFWHGTGPKSTLLSLLKSRPLIVTCVPDAPKLGITPVTTGGPERTGASSSLR